MQRFSDDEGQGLVEFVIMVPVLITVLYGTVVLADLCRDILKNHEAARYAIFALQKQPLSDYRTNRDLALAYTNATTTLAASATTLYHGLDPTNPGSSFESMAFTGNLNSVSFGAAANTPYLPVDTATQLIGSAGVLVTIIEKVASSLINYLMDDLAKNFGFNDHALATATATTNLTQRLLPINFFPQSDGTSPPSGIILTTPISLIVDSWNLSDGNDVMLPGTSAGSTQSGGEALMHSQVSQMALLLGGNNQTQVAQIIGDFVRAATIALPADMDPTTVRVVSKNYQGDTPQAIGSWPTGTISGKVNVYQAGLVSNGTGIATYDTMPMRDSFTAPYGDNIKAYQVRGKYYMGCPSAQKTPCSYQ